MGFPSQNKIGSEAQQHIAKTAYWCKGKLNFGEQVEYIDKILNFVTYYAKLGDEVALRRIWEMGKASHESLVRLNWVSEPDFFSA